MQGYIYLTENLVNGMCYIGKHSASKFNPKYLGLGKLIRQAIKEFGKENFKVQVLQWCETLKELNEAEVYWIAKCNAVDSPNFYNITCGNGGGKREYNGRFMYHLTDDEKQHLREINTGKHLTEETRQKISKSNTGHECTESTREKISKAVTGFKHTEEAKEKISAAKKGKHPWNSGKKCPKLSAIHKGTHYYNNGIIEVRKRECPEGFIKGRLPKPRKDLTKKEELANENS